MLIVFPGALGDLVCFIPAINLIATRHRGAAVELMARYELARFAVGRTVIRRAHSIDRAEVALLFTATAGESAAAREFFGAFARVYSFFAADDDRFRRNLSALVPDASFHPFRPPGAGHVATGYLAALDAPAGAALDARIELLPEDIAAASALRDRAELEPCSFLLLLPGSGSPIKNWPVEHFVALAKRLAPRIRSVAVLGLAEAGLAPAFHAAGITVFDGVELATVAALAAQAHRFVGNDSGVSHLAAAAGAAGVVLFGPTDPVRWRPLGVVHTLRCENLAKLAIERVAAALTVCQC